MNSDTLSKRSDAIAEEAAEYFIALKTPDARLKAEFIDWLKISPEHINEFLAVAALWDDLPHVSAQPSVGELVQLAAGEANVVAFSYADLSGGKLADGQPADLVRFRRRTKPRWFGFAAAAALAAVLVGGTLPQLLPMLDRNLYRTAIGEQTSVSLPDGSIVLLNTRSTMRVEYSDAFRVIHLTEGEALLDVAKDRARPFRVITGSAVIQAVGTQFNVRNIAEDVTVSVLDGIVDVSTKRHRNPADQLARLPDTEETGPVEAVIEPTRLTVGQQARIESRSGQVAVIEAPAVENAIAWQQRRLVFEHLSLEEVIDEFNRYNDPPIVIDDPELRKLPVSGVFRSNDPESFVQFLSQMNLADSRTRADGAIMLRGVQVD